MLSPGPVPLLRNELTSSAPSLLEGGESEHEVGGIKGVKAASFIQPNLVRATADATVLHAGRFHSPLGGAWAPRA